MENAKSNSGAVLSSEYKVNETWLLFRVDFKLLTMWFFDEFKSYQLNLHLNQLLRTRGRQYVRKYVPTHPGHVNFHLGRAWWKWVFRLVASVVVRSSVCPYSARNGIISVSNVLSAGVTLFVNQLLLQLLHNLIYLECSYWDLDRWVMRIDALRIDCGHSTHKAATPDRAATHLLTNAISNSTLSPVFMNMT